MRLLILALIAMSMTACGKAHETNDDPQGEAPAAQTVEISQATCAELISDHSGDYVLTGGSRTFYLNENVLSILAGSGFHALTDRTIVIANVCSFTITNGLVVAIAPYTPSVSCGGVFEPACQAPSGPMHLPGQ